MTVGALRPKKSLGQNFLRDGNVARKIVTSFAPDEGDVVVEIGPGEGALTSLLAGKVRRLIAVELDPRAAALLRDRFGGTIEVLPGDFLKYDLPGTVERAGTMVRLIGNIPYNITTPILFHILEHRAAVKDALLMMQKEVAERVTAQPGSKSYGIPSVFCQMFFAVLKLFEVSANVFYPRPAVTSAVVRLTTLRQPRYEIRNEEFFREMTRAVFGQRRKTLRNSLKAFLGEAPCASSSGIDLGRRPEDCSVEELARLSNTLFEKMKLHGFE